MGYYTQVDQTYQNLQSIFTEPSNTGLQQYMDQFFDSWQNLANNPADTPPDVQMTAADVTYVGGSSYYTITPQDGVPSAPSSAA